MCTATQKQEFIRVIDLLPEDRVGRLLGIAYDMISPTQVAPVNQGSFAASKDTRLQAFKAMEQLRAESPFPTGLDYDALRSEAMEDKYAHHA